MLKVLISFAIVRFGIFAKKLQAYPFRNAIGLCETAGKLLMDRNERAAVFANMEQTLEQIIGLAESRR